MAAWRYEISLLVLKKYFTSERNIFQYSKRNFVSPRGHVISSLFQAFVQCGRAKKASEQ